MKPHRVGAAFVGAPVLILLLGATQVSTALAAVNPNALPTTPPASTHRGGATGASGSTKLTPAGVRATELSRAIALGAIARRAKTRGSVGTGVSGAIGASGVGRARGASGVSGSASAPSLTVENEDALATLKGRHATGRRSSGGKLSAGALAGAVVAAVVALLCLVWALGRAFAYEPRWTLGLRHSLAEAAFRASSTWAEFTDWLRLGH